MKKLKFIESVENESFFGKYPEILKTLNDKPLGAMAEFRGDRKCSYLEKDNMVYVQFTNFSPYNIRENVVWVFPRKNVIGLTFRKISYGRGK